MKEGFKLGLFCCFCSVVLGEERGRFVEVVVGGVDSGGGGGSSREVVVVVVVMMMRVSEGGSGERARW